MKRFVVFGNDPSVTAILSRLREQDAASSVTIFSVEEEIPYYRHLLPDLIENESALKQIYVKPENYYHNENIRLVLGAKINRVNFRKSEIITDDKQKIAYDFLFLTDTGAEKFPAIKGINKTGVYSLRRLSDIKALSQSLMVTETVVVEDDGPLGIRMAWHLSRKGKDVILIVAERLLSQFVDEEVSEIIHSLISEQGIRIIHKNFIAEVLGDGDTKAIKLQSGKVLAAEAVVFGRLQADFRIFKNSELAIRDCVAINDFFQTNVANVYAWADCCSVKDSVFRDCDFYPDVVSQQAENALASILGGGFVPRSFIPHINISLADTSINVLGQTQPQAYTKEQVEADTENKRYRKIFFANNCMRGAVLINRQEECKGLLQDIEREQSREDVNEGTSSASLQEDFSDSSKGFLPTYQAPELIDHKP